MAECDKYILVTGGAGYIGSHCVYALLQNGYENIVIFDNLSTGHMETVESLKGCHRGNIRFFEGDLRKQSDLDKLFGEYEFNSVIHFAALSQVGQSMTSPSEYYHNNVCGTLYLLDAMIKHSVCKIVFSSTAATYGEPLYVPIDESHPQNPINTYGRTKLMIERIMDDYDRAYNLRSVRLRYFNVAGASSDAVIGEWHEPETHLIPNILKGTFAGEGGVKIFGTDYDTEDGTCVRDYINVEDLADAHILALKYLDKGGDTDFFNLGTSNGSSVMDILRTCEAVVKRKIPAEIRERRPGDPAALVADSSKAERVLGWSPKRTLEGSIRSAYEWEKKRH